MEDRRIVLPEEFQREFARKTVAASASALPSVGQPRADNGSEPRTIKILPDWSGIIWSVQSVEARGGLLRADGKPLRKLGVKMELLGAEDMFTFFHQQAINFAEFLHERDERLAEEAGQAKAGVEAKPARPSRAERKAKRAKKKRRKR